MTKPALPPPDRIEGPTFQSAPREDPETRQAKTLLGLLLAPAVGAVVAGLPLALLPTPEPGIGPILRVVTGLPWMAVFLCLPAMMVLAYPLHRLLVKAGIALLPFYVIGFACVAWNSLPIFGLLTGARMPPFPLVNQELLLTLWLGGAAGGCFFWWFRRPDRD